MAAKKRKAPAKVKPQPHTPEESFTERQLKFIQLYDGNGTQTAHLAGYRGTRNVLARTAHDLLKTPKIIEAIKARAKAELVPMVNDRISRQVFWSEIMNDDMATMGDRLRASELLGKSEADFAERHQHSGPDGKPIEFKSTLTDEQLDEAIQSLLSKGEHHEQ